MRVLANALVAVGLLIAIAGNAAALFALRVAMKGMGDPEQSGFRAVVWGVGSAHTFSLAGMVGCFLLVAGLMLAILRTPRGNDGRAR